MTIHPIPTLKPLDALIWTSFRHQNQASEACGVRSIAVKSTELNTEKDLKIRHFRELGVRFLSTLLDNK